MQNAASTPCLGCLLDAIRKAMGRNRRWCWLPLLLLAPAAHAVDFLKPGDYRVPLVHQALQRSYLVRMPPRADPVRPLPVVISFHGGGANAENHKWYSKMDETADREGFIAVYPNGSGGIGGLGLVFQITNTRVMHASVDGMLEKWIRHDGCPAQPEMSPPLSGKKGTADETHSMTRFAWRPCKDGAEVMLLKLKGPGHVWPGGQRDYLPHLLGTSTAVIDAKTEMWRFFSRHVRVNRP